MSCVLTGPSSRLSVLSSKLSPSDVPLVVAQEVWSATHGDFSAGARGDTLEVEPSVRTRLLHHDDFTDTRPSEMIAGALHDETIARREGPQHAAPFDDVSSHDSSRDQPREKQSQTKDGGNQLSHLAPSASSTGHPTKKGPVLFPGPFS